MSTPPPPSCRVDLAPPLADQFIVGVAPIDYGPILLLKPFRFHLTMDTLPSGVLLIGGFRSALICFQLSLSCPFRLLHTFPSLRPARHYPRFWIRRSSSERRRDFNPHEQRAAQHTLQRSPTSPERACPHCGLRLHRPVSSLGRPARPPRYPPSPAYCFSACRGSQTHQGRRVNVDLSQPAE